MRTKNYIVNLNEWLSKLGWTIYLKKKEKNREMDSTLMSGAWIREQTMNRRTTKGKDKESSLFCYYNNKKGRRTFEMVSTPFFSFDNVLHESQETVSCIYWWVSNIPCMYTPINELELINVFSFPDQVSAFKETPKLFQKKLYTW